MQRDFMSTGPVPVAGAESLCGLINRLGAAVAAGGGATTASLDWHPAVRLLGPSWALGLPAACRSGAAPRLPCSSRVAARGRCCHRPAVVPRMGPSSLERSPSAARPPSCRPPPLAHRCRTTSAL